MPTYKLKYFNGRGRGELIRIIFEVAGVKYEDVRIQYEDWPSLKPKTPFGQLPVLEIDGKEVSQSKAITRYLAREYGFYGANSREALDIDVVLELCDDLMAPLIAMFGENDKEKNRKYHDEQAPKVLGHLEKVLCQNNEGSGFFVGDKISMADLCFLTAVDFVSCPMFASPEHPDDLDSFTKLKALDGRIRCQNKIADWLKRQTPFGQLPMLEIDGQAIGQSKALGRYLGFVLGFFGANPRESLDIDVICELCDDLVSPLSATFGEQDEEKKKELVKRYYAESAPRHLGHLERLLCKNNEGNGFFVGDKISVADMVFLAVMDWVLTPEHTDALDSFTKLKALNDRIRAHDKIADWLKRRPETPF
ncbi:S-crystallin SL11-like [Amphiura filiformis]|uniref:S-crystallin SL11-like n=1 Tax=Amphiura filiformis TaxID=82378 RepID=UPI003B228152